MLFGKKKRKKKPRRSEQPGKRSRGFLMGSLALSITVLKPFAKMYATKLIRDYLRNQLSKGAAGRAGARGRSIY